MANGSIQISSLFRNPALKAIFEKAERDNGAAFAIPAPKAPVLSGGAAVRVLEAA
jgi:hypothetical protein